MAAAIVSIDIDHTQQLGSTRAEIAAEKAGIIKPGIPVVAGDMAAEPLKRRAARLRDSQARRSSRRAKAWSSSRRRTTIDGRASLA